MSKQPPTWTPFNESAWRTWPIAEPLADGTPPVFALWEVDDTITAHAVRHGLRTSVEFLTPEGDVHRQVCLEPWAAGLMAGMGPDEVLALAGSYEV
jgi:hypothetical protein